MPIDVSGFNVPAQDIRESAGLVRLADTMQRREGMEYRRSKDKEYDDYRKYQVVKDTIHPEDVAVGNATFDQWSASETKKIINEVMSDPAMKNGSYVDIYGMMQSKWQPVLSAANKMKAGFQQIDANVKASGTEDTNLATDDLAADAKLKLVQDTMPMGQDGKRVFNTSNHNPDKNYVKDILDSEDSWRYVKGPEPLINYIKNSKTEDFNPHKQLADGTIIPYKGKISKFKRPNVTPNEIGRLKNSDDPKFELMTEDDYVTEEDGSTTPVKLLDKKTYEDHIEKIPANKKVMDAMWNQNKKRHGIKSKNATEEEKRKRAFAVGVFQSYDPSGISPLYPQHMPRNTTNNYMGGRGGGAGAGGNVQGNAFDGIVKNIKHLPVKEGIIYNKDGESKFTGNWKIKSTDVPADVFAILNTGGYDLTDVEEFDAEIKDGGIVGLTPIQGKFSGKKIDSKAMVRSQHKYYNPGKGEPYVDFDKPDEPSGGGTIKGSEVPKGAKVIQKDGAYYYNGKKII